LIEGNDFLVRFLSIITAPGKIIDNVSSNTLIHYAGTTSSDTVNLLIKLGHKINHTNANGITPLAYTIMYRKWDMIELMLRYGASVYGKVVNYAIDYKIPSHLLYSMIFRVENYQDLVIDNDPMQVIRNMISNKYLNQEICKLPAIQLMIERNCLEIWPMIIKANSTDLIDCYINCGGILLGKTLRDVSKTNHITDTTIERIISLIPEHDEIFMSNNPGNIAYFLIHTDRLELTKKLIDNPIIFNIFKNPQNSCLDYAIGLKRISFCSFLIDNKINITITELNVNLINSIALHYQDFMRYIYCRCSMDDSHLQMIGDLIVNIHQCAIEIVTSNVLSERSMIRKLGNLVIDYNYVDDNNKTLEQYCESEYIINRIKNLQSESSQYAD